MHLNASANLTSFLLYNKLAQHDLQKLKVYQYKEMYQMLETIKKSRLCLLILKLFNEETHFDFSHIQW